MQGNHFLARGYGGRCPPRVYNKKGKAKPSLLYSNASRFLSLEQYINSALGIKVPSQKFGFFTGAKEHVDTVAFNGASGVLGEHEPCKGAVMCALGVGQSSRKHYGCAVGKDTLIRGNGYPRGKGTSCSAYGPFARLIEEHVAFIEVENFWSFGWVSVQISPDFRHGYFVFVYEPPLGHFTSDGGITTVVFRAV